MDTNKIRRIAKYKCHRVISHAIPDTIALVISKPLWILVTLSLINTLINICNFLFKF